MRFKERSHLHNIKCKMKWQCLYRSCSKLSKRSCCCSVTKLCLTLCNPMDCSTPGFPVPPSSWNLPKFMSIELVMPSNHFILYHPLLLLPSVFPSFRVFPNESVLRIRWPKYWSFSFSIGPSKEYSGLISFNIDWFDIAFQGTLKSLLQHHSLKASVFWCSVVFIVQPTVHPYMITERTIAFTMWTSVVKVMSLLFNTLSRFVIAFLQGCSHLLISWLQSHLQWF